MKGGKQNSDAVAGDNGVSSEQPSTGASQAEQQERDGDAGEEDEDVGKEYEEKLEEEELADVEKPKLAEGFYEIEDVWRKRVRKVSFILESNEFSLFFVTFFILI